MKRFLIGFCAVVFPMVLVVSFAWAGEKADCEAADEACWLKILKTGKDAAPLRAAMALGEAKSEAAVPDLIKKLSTKDEYLATACVHALVKIGDAAVPALVDATTAKSAAVRKYAVYALGKIGGGKAVRAIGKLAHDEDPDVRIKAAQAFATLKDPEAGFDLLALLQDRHRPVKLEAIRAMSVMPNSKTVIPIVDYGLSDLDDRVSMEAAALLIKIGPDAVPTLLDTLPGRPPYVRKRIAGILGELAVNAPPATRGQVEKTLIILAKQKSETQEVRQASCVGLGTLGGPDAKAALQEIVKECAGNTEAAPLGKAASDALARIPSKK